MSTAKLQYSTQALNVKNRFHRRDIMLFVEGQDDVIFWECLVEKFSDHRIKVEHVGGKENLERYIGGVCDGSIEAVVAADSDFAIFDGSRANNRNLLLTYGHSIENSLVNSYSLKEVIRIFGKLSSRDIDEAECVAWLMDTYEKLQPLVLCDIENEVSKTGVKVMPNDTFSIFKSRKSCFVCEEKVNARVIDVNINISEDQQENYKRTAAEHGRDVTDYLRGHLLFSAAIRYVSKVVEEKRKKTNLSVDSFFTNLILIFKNEIVNSHEQGDYYKSLIKNIVV